MLCILIIVVYCARTGVHCQSDVLYSINCFYSERVFYYTVDFPHFMVEIAVYVRLLVTVRLYNFWDNPLWSRCSRVVRKSGQSQWL